MLSTSYNAFIIFTFGFVFVQSDPIDFSDCGSDYQVLQVDLEGCKVIPCKLKMGSYYNVSMILEPNSKSNSLSQEAYITLFNSIDLTIEVVPNPCALPSCPLQTSDGTKFQGRVFIGTNLMATKGMLWWKMHTDSGGVAVCIKTTVQVVNKS